MTQKVNLYNVLDSDGVPINAGGLIDPASGAVLVKPVDVAAPVYNPSGSTITKGALVYISGWDATNGCPAITLADATDATKPAELVVLGEILTHATGYANGMAAVAGAYNTSARTVGDIAYLSITTPGGIQWTAPVVTGQQIQPVGVATTKATVGDVYFFPCIGKRTVPTQGQHLVFDIPIVKLRATGDIYASVPLGFAGKVTNMFAVVNSTCSATTSATAAIDLLMGAAGATAMTGLTIPVSALTAAACNTFGSVIAGSGTPAVNTFVATDLLTVHVTQGSTQFGAGDTGTIELHIVTN